MIARVGWFLAASVMWTVLLGDGAQLTSVRGAAAWFVHAPLSLLAGFALIELGLIVAGRYSARARARIDLQLHAALRRAADRLPADRRAAYLREWEGELHAILQGPPVARVWPALRYVAGLRRAAPAIARVLDPGRPAGRLRAAGRGARAFALGVVLIPLVTSVVLLFVALIVVGMLLVAVWAAAVATTGRRAFRETFVRGCRRTGLCLFGWPAADDAPGEQTILSL
ncbi:hypothetical protein [Virgisporangium aurantiacum]|uniref:Uncharacterized protein n=1 Tax=Virgisporangium aurantiacum TaxID=175570 RepID=A0A8J3ZFJ8_9ACTN|nr:hypothetical protein [Virgisporangium aurantiacum]GIJ60930.1 hypothetical protein Vau01_084460 [Virgisporangium aurantiacum]